MRISDWSSDVCSSDLFDPASDRELNIARNPRPRLAELDCRNARKRNALIALEAVIERTIGDGDGVIVDRDRFGLPFQRLPDDCVHTRPPKASKPPKPLSVQIGSASCRARVCKSV